MCSCPCLSIPQVYSGGLGSYALLVMVAAFLQLHPSRAPAGVQRSCALYCSLVAALVAPGQQRHCLHSRQRLPAGSLSPSHSCLNSIPPAASGYGYKGKRGAAEEIEGSLGVLLVDFLRLYGRALNNQEVGAS